MNNVSVSFRGLVPLNEYNGTILKLTKKDKKAISILQKAISDYEADCYENIRHKSLKKTWTEKDSIAYFIRGIKNSETIEQLQKEIAQIKQNRLQKQQEKAKRLLAKV